MKYLVSALFIVVGLIHLAPVSGAFSVGALERLYGVSGIDPDIAFLMRHRAVLFGIVGATLLFAAFLPAYRPIAAAIGLASMTSYVILFFALAPAAAPLAKVMWVDVVGIVLLVGALVIDVMSARGSA